MSQKPSDRPSSDGPLASAANAENNTDNAVEGIEEESRNLWLFQYVPSWLTSFVMHVTIILLLTLVTNLVPTKEPVNLVAGDAGESVETDSDINMDPLGDFNETLEKQSAIDVSQPSLVPITDAPEIGSISDLNVASDILNTAEMGMEASGNAFSAALPSGGNEFSGRSDAGRGAKARNAGANDATEGAVALGLKWLANHQLPDGSWNFNHQVGPGDRSSPNPGQFDDCPIAATSMCLMAFLGNGQTHREGDYKELVGKGLNYLVKNQRRVNETCGSLLDSDGRSSMYAHGLATIVLCEAYGMTKDTGLHDPAQAAINYIAFAQDPTGGGWRYRPKETGDLSVAGWQLMALKSGLMSDLEVSRITTKRSVKFLDAVSHASSSKYGYRAGNQDSSPNMTAVGLLCRMYMGWKHDHPALRKGVEYLAKRGPEIGDSTNMYYNYYAAQVLRQYGGDGWTEWNKLMRDHLVKELSREGVTKGSWYFKGGADYGPEAGGRIYCTAMAVMTLEVYYRFLPIYRDAAMEEEFPLD